jgi:glycine hydroxymethyltransferase
MTTEFANSLLLQRPDPRLVLARQDAEIFDAIEAEYVRQNEGIEMIASENYVSPAVLDRKSVV